MKMLRLLLPLLASTLLADHHTPRAVLPDAVVDLRTPAGVARVNAQWRYRDAQIQEIEHRSVGAELKASGPKNRTFDFTPDARATDFDDSKWEIIPADSLEKRRSNGRLSLNWYRLNVTIPEKVGGFDTKGSTAVFEIVVDDYAEVSVNGQAPFVLGQNGGTVAAGWNAPNRVVLTRDARPGEKFQIAVLGINGPLSTHPDTYIWVRSATLDFYAPSKIQRLRDVKLEVERKHDDLDQIIPPWTKLFKLADGFTFTEGPVWVPGESSAGWQPAVSPTGSRQALGANEVRRLPIGDTADYQSALRDNADGYLLFSDPNNNVIYRLTREGDVQIYMTKSGYAGEDIGEYGQPGANGLTLDQQGRLTIAQHGNRRVIRIEKNGLITVLADRFEGKRLNSPNDLVYRSDGTLFFTDPPFGLPKAHRDSRRELPHYGVYSVKDSQVRLVSKDFTGPNGLAFSPDEQFLYVGNWDETSKVVMRYPVNEDGTLGEGDVFFDMTSAPGHDAIDGVKMDERGNVYVSGPGGLWIIDRHGRHLGTVRGPEHPHNMAWGGADGRTLFLAAQTGIYSLRLNVAGAGAWTKPTAMAKP
jgi:gluconolactonase